MTVLCIDDEEILLRSLGVAVNGSGLAEANCFSDEWDGLRWAKDNKPEAAFLDIRLHELDGLELAERLREINPDIFIVFCTGFAEYAVDAINRGLADGYLLKPVRAGDVRKMLEKATQRKKEEKLVTVRCYGGFDVFDKNGTIISFHRKRAKELLALLIHKKGMSITSKEICAMMFEDDGEMDRKNMDYLRKLYGELKQSMTDAGAEEILKRNGALISVDMTKIALDESGKDSEGYLPDYLWAMTY